MLKRFVTYIYLYDRGNRGPNVGFVKADIRDAGCRMELRLRGLDRFQGKGRVYLIVSDEKTVGIPAGEITIQQGMGHLKLAYARNLLGASGYSVTQIQAIVIRGGGSKLLISCWSEQVPESVLRGTFTIWEDTQSAAAPEISDESLSQKNEPEEPPTVGIADAPTAPDETLIDFGVSSDSAVDTMQTSPPENESTQSAISEAEDQATENTTATIKAEEIPVSVSAETKADTMPGSTSPVDTPVLTATEIAADSAANAMADVIAPVSITTQEEINTTPDSAVSAEASVPVTTDANNTIIPEQRQTSPPPPAQTESSCPCQNNRPSESVSDTDTPAPEPPVCTYQKIALTDIRAMLPKPNWYLCSNSFLIHGFFNYHYLILKTVVYNGQKKCYLGVPGIYEQPERTMAFMFGFPSFEPARARKEDAHTCADHASAPAAANETGIFGYWMLQLLD